MKVSLATTFFLGRDGATIQFSDPHRVLFDLRGTARIARVVVVGLRLPAAVIPDLGSDDSSSGSWPTMLGALTLSGGAVGRLGAEVHAGVRGVVSFPTGAGDERLARDLSRIEMSYAPGELYNFDEIAFRGEVALRIERGPGAFELAVSVGRRSEETEGVTFAHKTFWCVGVGGGARVRGVDLLAEAFVVRDSSEYRTAVHLGARLPTRLPLVVRASVSWAEETIYWDDGPIFGLGVGGELSAPR